MGAMEFAEEIRNQGMGLAAAEGGYFSDEEVVAHVREALQSVALGDREQYEWLLYEVLDPTDNAGPDHEALLVATLKALSGVVSFIDVDYHRSLYTSMSLWKHGPDVRSALVDLTICLAASGGLYFDGCLDMLVRNFLPPRKLQQHFNEHEWLSRKKDVASCVLSALQSITQLVPLTPMRLWPIIIREMPKSAAHKDLVLYVECMLQLESSMIGEFIGSSLLKALVDRLMELDVDISWEEIRQEDYCKGIFEMELEDIQETAGDDDRNGKIQGEIQDCQGNKVSDKLDSLDCLMALTCNHLKSCADDGRLVQVFKTLIESFQKTVMNAYKSKFSQFVMFYACSLDPENCGTQFAFLLRDTFLSRTNPPLFRMSGVAYLASYLSRAKFLVASLVADILESLIDWCFEYCQFIDCKKTINPMVHRVFYSGCQAVLYILCFRMKSLLNDPFLRSRLLHMPLESVLHHPLDPLKVCLPSIVEEFLHQAKVAHLFSTSRTFLFDNILESDLSKTFGGMERLDMFFPFDPYLLKESDRFIRPNFVFWSTVKKAYDDYDSEEEATDEVFEDGHGTCLEKTHLSEYSDIDSEDDLGCSMDKMSITPKDTFKHRFAGNLVAPPSMPARIRPSMSPC
ncbi:hypothetical protein Taro_031848 [Colocasia esculenta]|uniref:RNA polymerase I-specific transcription initiation factor RRN3 n=1 Tax=Colocasia esculenta TaxID=4460 RepID=A0A843W049_COLES|nr:hypothetical protein [Colocasia esculenta]